MNPRIIRGHDATRGTETLLVSDRSRAIATMVVSLPVGSLHDPPGREGLAFLTGQMLLRGAADMDHATFTDEVDFLGSALSVGVGRERTHLSGDALTRNIDAFERLVGAALAEPTFDPDQLERLKRQTLAELAEVRDHDAALGQRFFVRRLFGDHPYGRALRGSERSIAAITVEDVRAFYRAHYRCQGSLVGAAGDIDADRLDAYVARTLGRISSGSSPALTLPPPPRSEGYRVTLVDKPARSQTQVFIGHPTVDANHADFFPLLVGHTIFGGTFTARLSHEIREKRGWSYGAYSHLATDRRLGTFLMHFYPATGDTVPAMKVADDFFRRLVADGVSDDEARFAVDYLRHSHAFTVDTPERLLGELLGARFAGRPDAFVETFVERLRAVTAPQINAALAKHLTPDGVVACVVATAADLEPEVRAWERVDHVETIDHATPIDAI